MSARLWSALVILKDHSADAGADVNGNFDLSEKYVTIEYQDTFPRNAIIVLNAKGGRFITQTPKIQKWDRIYLEITDQGNFRCKQVFQIEYLEKMRPRGKGMQLKLYLTHQSSNLLTQTISRANRRVSGNAAMQNIMTQMNDNSPIRDPLIENITTTFDPITKRGILLDKFTTNDYIFESVKAQTAINEIIDREGNPVEGGGSFEFFFFNFDSLYEHPDNAKLNSVAVQCFPQGFVWGGSEFTNIPLVTLTKPVLEPGVHANTLALDSQLETERGTNIIGIGDFVSGSYPTAYSKYTGAKEVFDSAANWETGRIYRKGTLVTDAGLTYESTVEHVSTTAPPNAFWTARVFDVNLIITWNGLGDFVKETVVKHNTIAYKSLQTPNVNHEPPDPEFWRRVSWAPTVDYSPLTKGNSGAQYWINAGGGANQSETNNRRTAVIDPSVVIRDSKHPRTWCDAMSDDSVNAAFLPDYLFPNGDQNNPFEGFRVLVANPITGATDTMPISNNKFAANYDAVEDTGYDINGRPFANNIAEWQIIDDVGQYVVIDLNSKFGDESLYPRPPSPANNDLLDDQEVYDYNAGLSWIYQPEIPPLNVTRFTDWQKGAYVGVSDTELAIFFPNDQFTCVHAPRWDSGNSRVDIFSGRIRQADTDIDGDSAVFVKFDPEPFATPIPSPFTFPFKGRFIGLNFAFPWPRTAQPLPYGAPVIGEQIANPFFDILNFDKTIDGSRKWFGPEVEDYYPFQAVGFSELIQDKHFLTSLFRFRGDYSMAIWLMDNRDRIWIIEYGHGHNDQTEGKTASMAIRKVFRARFGIEGLIDPQQPEVIDIVDPRRIVRGGIYSKMSFNAFGQYDPRNPFADSADGLTYALDAFRMVKPLICTNNDEPNALPERNKEPQKLQAEKMVSYPQLKNLVLSIEAIYNFRTDKYNLLTPGRCQINYGDPVYYEDPEAIDETTDSLPNTVKAVASNVIYSLSKTPDGPGGFIRNVHLTTRLWPDEEVPP